MVGPLSVVLLLLLLLLLNQAINCDCPITGITLFHPDISAEFNIINGNHLLYLYILRPSVRPSKHPSTHPYSDCWYLAFKSFMAQRRHLDEQIMFFMSMPPSPPPHQPDHPPPSGRHTLSYFLCVSITVAGFFPFDILS